MKFLPEKDRVDGKASVSNPQPELSFQFRRRDGSSTAGPS